MKNWKELKVGDKVVETVNDFDCVKPIKVHCEITKVEEDHAIATEINDFDYKMTLWIDDDTQDMFEKE